MVSMSTVEHCSQQLNPNPNWQHANFLLAPVSCSSGEAMNQCGAGLEQFYLCWLLAAFFETMLS